MARTVADFITEALQQAGVKRVFGVVGDSLNAFTDSLRRQEQIQWIHMRTEESAAFAAGAEAHLTGELAVCAGSCGPGNLHLINGLFDAHRSGVPVLALAAHIPGSEIGIDYFQATHPESLFQECSHYVELVSRAVDEGRLRAGEGGPVVLAFVLWSALHGLVATRVAKPNMPGPPADLLVEAILEAFLHGVATEPA